MVILEHLLKRLYVNSPYDFNGWERTIRTQRNDLELLLEDAPSLKTLWDASFDKAWKIALRTVREEYPQVNFPTQWPYSQQVETMLNDKFWENLED
ncbi:MAG: DUF29 domain-containing protein, partial [Symploca sp. SIO2E6]|nr:DUF29 domain-containing protein [Symploca sp. SIO2E6]